MGNILNCQRSVKNYIKISRETKKLTDQTRICNQKPSSFINFHFHHQRYILDTKNSFQICFKKLYVYKGFKKSLGRDLPVLTRQHILKRYIQHLREGKKSINGQNVDTTFCRVSKKLVLALASVTLRREVSSSKIVEILNQIKKKKQVA